VLTDVPLGAAGSSRAAAAPVIPGGRSRLPVSHRLCELIQVKLARLDTQPVPRSSGE
jgi:hypothetical protein